MLKSELLQISDSSIQNKYPLKQLKQIIDNLIVSSCAIS